MQAAKHLKYILIHRIKVGLNDIRRGREEWAWAKMLVQDQA
jgi:hypothetical protein